MGSRDHEGFADRIETMAGVVRWKARRQLETGNREDRLKRIFDFASVESAHGGATDGIVRRQFPVQPGEQLFLLLGAGLRFLFRWHLVAIDTGIHFGPVFAGMRIAPVDVEDIEIEIAFGGQFIMTIDAVAVDDIERGLRNRGGCIRGRLGESQSRKHPGCQNEREGAHGEA